ncbi:MAG: MFS transporter [SAR202 cluster bacterium]|nr:MFS transporter [SAR202 cluster bacterium]
MASTSHAPSHIPSAPPARTVKRALRLSTMEGVAFGAFIGLGEHFILAFAVAMSGSSLEIGLLASLPGFLGSIAQLFDTRLVQLLKSRKAVVLIFALAQGLILLPLIAVVFIDSGQGVWWLVLFASLYSIFGALISPAWGSIMSQLVPGKLRGSYFSRRSRLSTLANVMSFLLAGLFLNQLVEKELWGFAVLFGAAVVARLISWALLTRLHEPDKELYQVAHASHTSNNAQRHNLRTYLLFLFCMSFAVNIASPYFTLYQLRDLGMDYLTFVALEAVSTLATLVAITHWGQATALEIVKFCS